jgi:hypothetical protein
MTFDNFVTANFYKQKLEENEIACYLADEYTITVKWILSNAMGGIKLRVLNDEREKAMQIIDEKYEDIQVDFNIDNSELTCPGCGSNNTMTEKFSRPIAGLSWLILGFPIRFNLRKANRCYYCGHWWTE